MNEPTKSDVFLIKELHAAIELHLDQCDSDKTPKLCEFRSTEEGRKILLNEIANRIITSGGTIEFHMGKIEKEYTT